jgi:copper chaperone CopZ
MEAKGLVWANLTVGGINCGGCVAQAEKTLRAIPGVAAAEVALAERRARVQYDPAQAAPQNLAAALSKAGFPSSVSE